MLKEEHPVLHTRYYRLHRLGEALFYDLPKVSATHPDGYRATALCPVVGPRAADKAIKTANSILARSVWICRVCSSAYVLLNVW